MDSAPLHIAIYPWFSMGHLNSYLHLSNKCGNSPEECDILPNSRLSERVSPKRETQYIKFGNSRNLTQARNWSHEREKPRQVVRFSLERKGPCFES
ncbi:hypothetical protein Lal_00033675 [Lupinus albus]|nr:hypothetical protein Lal_00033675 [Lupinus albus]